jgi:hypothetical protein
MQETEIKKRIESIFESANLSQDDRSLWLSRLSRSGEQFQRAFVQLFDGETEMLGFFTNDLRKRTEAGNDPEKLSSILQEEKVYFADILSKKS